MPDYASTLTPRDLAAWLVRRGRWLVAPAVVGGMLAAVGTLVFPRSWKAEQGILIRSDAAGYAEQRLGKFTDLAEMKTVQETLLELAKSGTVVTEVLKEVGPPSAWRLGEWPTAQDVADFRDNLRFAPPGGAEFGKTEVFYLGVLDPSRKRAVALVEATARQLDKRLRYLRDERAASIVTEVENSVTIARELLHKHSTALAEFERGVGADLVELRNLTNPTGGQSELGQRMLAIDAERRASVERRRQNEALLVELRAAAEDPQRLIATPDALLASQPALRRLKNGLVDAQLLAARAGGARTNDHPFVLAARESREQVARELGKELPTAIAGIELELSVAQQREAELAGDQEKLRERSARIASIRSQYAELTANVEGQTRSLETALKQLADAKSHQAGVNSASLLAPIDGVETGVRPVGPGRVAVTLAGSLAGAIAGAALAFAMDPPKGRAGRRATDVAGGQPILGPGGRRANDPVWTAQPVATETPATAASQTLKAPTLNAPTLNTPTVATPPMSAQTTTAQQAGPKPTVLAPRTEAGATTAPAQQAGPALPADPPKPSGPAKPPGSLPAAPSKTGLAPPRREADGKPVVAPLDTDIDWYRTLAATPPDPARN